MTIAGFAALFADGAPAAPAPPPGAVPFAPLDDFPARAPSYAPGITDPSPNGRRMARIQFSAGMEFRSKLH